MVYLISLMLYLYTIISMTTACMQCMDLHIGLFYFSCKLHQ